MSITITKSASTKEVLGSGSTHTDVTEHTLFQVEKNKPFGFSGWVDLKNLASGSVVIKQYYKLLSNGAYSLHAEDSYGSPLPETLIHLREKVIVLGAKVTIHQISGSGFVVYWEFYNE